MQKIYVLNCFKNIISLIWVSIRRTIYFHKIIQEILNATLTINITAGKNFLYTSVNNFVCLIPSDFQFKSLKKKSFEFKNS